MRRGGGFILGVAVAALLIVAACKLVNAQAVFTAPGVDNTQRIRAVTDTTGVYTWTYPNAYAAGVVPVIEATAEGASGSTDVINVQTNGAPTNTSVTVRVTRTQQSVVALLGLTILSIPATVGATTVNITARAP